MFRLLVLCTSIAITLAFKNEAECGQRPFNPNRIVNGSPSAQFDWGWQVMLNQNFGFTCGGILVNKQWVLTAAHCVKSPFGIQVVLGAHNKTQLSGSNIQTTSPATVYSHPQFDATTLANDIALLKLNKILKYDNYTIPACLPEGDDTFENEKAVVTGWGAVSLNGAMPVYLSESVIKIDTEEECLNRYGHGYFKTSLQLCTDKDGPCKGDSGGPLTYVSEKLEKPIVIGVTSWGIGCGEGAVFTRISGYRSWYENIIDKN